VRAGRTTTVDAAGGPSSDCCCDYLNFFIAIAIATGTARTLAHAQIPGHLLTQPEAETPVRATARQHPTLSSKKATHVISREARHLVTLIRAQFGLPELPPTPGSPAHRRPTAMLTSPCQPEGEEGSVR
jgi:hypothetical protein